MKLSKDVRKIKKDLEKLKKDSPESKDIIKAFETPIQKLEELVKDQHKKEDRQKLICDIKDKIDDMLISTEDALNYNPKNKPSLK